MVSDIFLNGGCPLVPPAGGAYYAESARRFDLSDRYLNSQAVRAHLHAGKIDAAERIAALFTKDGDQVSTLYDMQHMWYEVAAGRAHLERKEYGKVGWGKGECWRGRGGQLSLWEGEASESGG